MIFFYTRYNLLIKMRKFGFSYTSIFILLAYELDSVANLKISYLRPLAFALKNEVRHQPDSFKGKWTGFTVYIWVLEELRNSLEAKKVTW